VNTSDSLTTREVAARAKVAAADLALATRATKDAALLDIADALVAAESQITEANALDLAAARVNGTSAALIDRLTITGERLGVIADAVRDVAELPDPIGEVIRGYTLPNGLRVLQRRVPMGVIGMIYEARPNVTVDAGVLALKSGNAALLRGSSSAYHTNQALVSVMRSALAHTPLPVDSIQLVPGTTHASVTELLTARGLVDLIIPRGGASLIKSVIEQATVPVIETGVGNCHVYVDAAADLDKAANILLNAKTSRPSVCNAAETVLIHTDVAEQFLKAALPLLAEAGVTLHGDDEILRLARGSDVPVVAANDADWEQEYYSLDIAARIVPNIDAAIAHISRWSTGHTEAIVSDSATAISAFTDEVDSAVIMVNASTRFTDGAEFGFGAEIGISTQKLHARGPMGLAELTSTKYVVTGDGHVRS